jgi:myo-inositol-1(or 4)-monophosphatase
MLVVQEAGGKVTDFRGGKGNIYDKQILASNEVLHEAMLRVLAATVDSPHA